MIRSLLFIAFCIGFINANFLSDLFYSEASQVVGLSFSLKAANPTEYDHAQGGGSYSSGVNSFDGFYFACGDRASLVLLVSADQTYTQGTSAVYTLDFTAHAALKIKSAVNNCASNTADRNAVCVAGEGLSVTLSGNSIQFTKLAKGARAVIRIDFIVDCAGLGSSGPALTINSYKSGSGSAVPLTGVSVDFVRCSNVFNLTMEMLVPRIR